MLLNLNLNAKKYKWNLKLETCYLKFQIKELSQNFKLELFSTQSFKQTRAQLKFVSEIMLTYNLRQTLSLSETFDW